jgi:serine/threonine protein kinase
MDNEQGMNKFSEMKKKLGHYQITDQIGQGGMAVVYLGVQQSLNRKVAIKVLPVQFAKSEELVGRFDREAHIAAQLNHPNIVQIIDRGKDQDTLFIVMEYVEGEGLDQVIGRGDLTIGKIVGYSLQICDALSYAHDKGVVHRDLKPSNILIDKHSGRAKITDFGIAQIADHAPGMSTLTTQNAALGTINYMSPEQRTDSHSVTYLTDIFSFGIMLYQMLTGKLPFGHFKLPSQINHDIPMGFDTIVKKCLQENPADRYQSARELQAALGDITGWQTKYKDLAVKVQHSVRQMGTHTPSWISGKVKYVVAGVGLLAALAVLFKIYTSEDHVPGVSMNEPTQVAAVPSGGADQIETPEVSETPGTEPAPPTRPPPTPTIDAATLLRNKLKRQIASAETMISKDELDPALSLLQEIVETHKTHPLSAQAQYLIAEIRLDKSEYVSAIKEYEFLVRLFPGSSLASKALYQVGLIYGKLGNASEEQTRLDYYAKSFQTFDQILKDYPTSTIIAQAKLERSKIEWKSLEKKGVFKKKYAREDQQRLVKDVKALLESHPKGSHVAPALQLIARISKEPELKNYLGAAEAMMQLYTMDPRTGPDSLYQACEYYREAGHITTEKKVCQQFIDTYPDDSRTPGLRLRIKEI